MQNSTSLKSIKLFAGIKKNLQEQNHIHLLFAFQELSADNRCKQVRLLDPKQTWQHSSLCQTEDTLILLQ